MKVNIYTTVEVSDEQRVQIAAEIDGEGAKKRAATRDEMKAFVWREGENWASALSGDNEAEPVEPAESDDEREAANGNGVEAEDEGDDEDFLS